MAAEPVFIDTNVLVAATVETHPSHATAVALLARLIADQAPLAISHADLQGVPGGPHPTAGRGPDLFRGRSLAALARWRSSCAVLDDDKAVLAGLLDLVRRHDAKGKQVHDANVVATMRANGIARLATFNVGDFQRYEDEVRIEPGVS